MIRKLIKQTVQVGAFTASLSAAALAQTASSQGTGVQAGGAAATNVSPADSGAVTALRAKDFTQALGVNTHIGYLDSTYGNLQNIQNELAYLGIHRVRDHRPDTDLLDRFQTLASAGIQFDLVINYDNSDLDLAHNLPLIDAFEQSRPGSVLSVEGPNELNDANNRDSFNGMNSSDPAVGVKIMKALYAGVKADSTLAGVSVVNESISNGIAGWEQYLNGLGDLSAYVDQGNWHIYFNYGAVPAPIVQAMILDAQHSAPGRPVTITETGYPNALDDTSGFGAVDQATQAKEVLADLLDLFKNKVTNTYIYELMDLKVNPPSNSLIDNWGMFLGDGTPKPVAKAIHNLTTILADSDPAAKSFSTASLDYTLGNMPVTGNSLLLQKANGVYDLVLWAEPQIWDSANKRDIPVSPTNVSVSFGSVPGAVQVFDTLAGTDGVAATPAASMSFALSDHPIVLQITPGSIPPVSGVPTIATTAWYNVVNLNSGNCIDGFGWGTTDGTPVVQWACGASSWNQEWQLTPTDSGFYTVADRWAPTKVLDVTGEGTTNGSQVHIWGSWGGTNQQWMPVALGNGYYKFVGRQSGRCLDVPGASLAAGVNLQIYDCNGTGAQAFQLSVQP